VSPLRGEERWEGLLVRRLKPTVNKVLSLRDIREFYDFNRIHTMIKKFEDITKIEDRELFDKVSAYCDDLIDEATANGSLADQYADNEYTREIGRVANMCANYETYFMTFKCLNFNKSPLVATIESELEKRALKQQQAAELLEVKESTFRQIMRGKRRISMPIAKKLYKSLQIDPKLIVEYA
jgi:antitoxin component HigA of HigAB toxin-antitoxin module